MLQVVCMKEFREDYKINFQVKEKYLSCYDRIKIDSILLFDVLYLKIRRFSIEVW